MEFFPSHTPSEYTQKGIFNRKNDICFLEEQPEIQIKNNRAIYGDSVLVHNNEVVGIEKRNKEHIVGILYLNLNQKYGFTKKGVPIIKFVPLSNKYPTFMVPSKSRERTAQICVISFNKWEVVNKQPIGQIEKIIGNVGDINNETQGILYKNKMYPLGKSRQRHAQNILSRDEIQKHPWICSKGVDYETFSIDPQGCRDIDDAFHIKQIDSNEFEVGIHIADVASKLNLEKINFCFYSSIYLQNGKQENMLNDDFTFNSASLGDGEPKRAVSLILQYNLTDKMKPKLTSLCFKSTLVRNTALSYCKADLLISSDSHTNDKLQIQSSLKLLNKLAFYLSKTPENYSVIPATKMVEHFMLLYNTLTAETLYSYNKSTIMRRHRLTNIQHKSLQDPELSSYLERTQQSAAEYVINRSEEDVAHEGLSFSFYTHATSPIRRYVDIINQYNILRYISSLPLYQISQAEVERINSFNKNLRKFYNNYKKLKLVFNCEIEKSEYTAYIIEIKKHKIKVFIPELDIEHSCQILSHKLEVLDRVIVGETDEPYSWIQIDTIKLSLYDKVKLSITTLPKETLFNKKLYCKLVEPEISVL